MERFCDGHRDLCFLMLWSFLLGRSADKISFTFVWTWPNSQYFALLITVAIS